MSPRMLFVATVFVAIVNGIVSPAVFLVFALSPVWAPTIVAPSGQTLLMLTSLVVSTGTLLLAGVPAAIYERLAGKVQSSNVSMAIWLAGAVLLTLPGLMRYF
jgi:hypothetical protein